MVGRYDSAVRLCGDSFYLNGEELDMDVFLNRARRVLRDQDVVEDSLEAVQELETLVAELEKR